MFSTCTRMLLRFPWVSTKFMYGPSRYQHLDATFGLSGYLCLCSFPPKAPVRPDGVCRCELPVSGNISSIEGSPESRRFGSSQHHLYLDCLRHSKGERGMGRGGDLRPKSFSQSSRSRQRMGQSMPPAATFCSFVETIIGSQRRFCWEIVVDG